MCKSIHCDPFPHKYMNMYPHHFPWDCAHGIFLKHGKYYALYPWHFHNSDAMAQVDTYNCGQDQPKDKLAYTIWRKYKIKYIEHYMNYTFQSIYVALTRIKWGFVAIVFLSIGLHAHHTLLIFIPFCSQSENDNMISCLVSQICFLEFDACLVFYQCHSINQIWI